MKKLAQALIVFTVMVGGFLAPLHVSVEKQTALTANSYSIDVGINHADAFNPALWLFGLDSDSIANGVQAALLSFWKVIIFDFTQMLAGFAGWFMDFFLQYSIDANTYRTGIIEAGWEIIRNMVNIVFIFSLLTIAFQKVLGSSGAGLNRRLMKTILVALAVNFSLFASFLVIDASNILTTVIYNQIEVVGELDSKSRVKETSWVEDLFRDSETKSISIAVTSKFNPQKLALFKTADGTPLNLGQRFFLYTIAGLLNILLISVFLSVSFVFLTRTIVLMFIGILAPLAFASITLPGMEKLKYVGFNDWQKQLINLSFTAPVFVFFLYLIVVFATDKSFMGSVSFTNETGNFIATIMQVLLPFALIATLLKTAEIVTKSMVVGIGGKVSEMVSKTVGTATGAVAQVGIAAATGGASFGVTAIKGAVAKKGFGQTVKSAASSGLRTFRNTKFDISKYPGFKDAKSFGSVRDVQLMGKKKYSDLRYGTSKNEFEYQKEKEKIRTQIIFHIDNFCFFSKFNKFF